MANNPLISHNKPLFLLGVVLIGVVGRAMISIINGVVPRVDGHKLMGSLGLFHPTCRDGRTPRRTGFWAHLVCDQFFCTTWDVEKPCK